MVKSNKRIWILLLLALILGGVYWYDNQYGFLQQTASLENVTNSLSDFTGAVPVTIDTLPALYRTRADLRNFQSRHEEIDRAYFNVASTYADQISDLTGLITEKNTDDKVFIETALRTKLDEVGTLEDIKINVAESESLSKQGGRKALADISFATGSSQDAARVVLDLGNGKNGMIWRNLSLVTDRMRRQVVLNGRLTIFLAEAAE